MPRELALREGGVGVFWGRVGPREFPRHAHAEVEVATSFRGSAGTAIWETETGGRARHRMDPGYVSVLPPWQPHSGVWEQEAEVLVFYLGPVFVAGVAEDLGYGDRAELVGVFSFGDALIRQLASAVRAEMASENPPGGFYLESAATVLAAHLLRRYSPTAKAARERAGGLGAAALGRAREYVEENLAGDLSLSAISGAAGFSPHHFSRAFKRSTGLSPHAYAVSRRVERARALLISTDLPMAEVARRSGFSSQSLMGRHVRRLLGVTPSAIRFSARR